jgi:hypothetical protein
MTLNYGAESGTSSDEAEVAMYLVFRAFLYVTSRGHRGSVLFTDLPKYHTPTVMPPKEGRAQRGKRAIKGEKSY